MILELADIQILPGKQAEFDAAIERMQSLGGTPVLFDYEPLARAAATNSPSR